MIPFLAVSAVVPSLLLMWFFHARDVFREPPKVLWTTFFLGVLTIPGVLLVVLPFESLVGLDQIREPYTQGFSTAFLHAAVPEECFKFLVVYLYARRNPAFDEPADGVVYGVAASLGFATLENVLYVFGGGVGTAVMRAFTAVPAHAFFGAIMGYFVGQAHFRPQERGKLLAGALFWPILMHGLYDAPLLTLQAMGEATSAVAPLLLGFLVVFVWTAVWALRLAGRLRKEQLALLAQLQAQGLAPAMAGGTPAPPMGQPMGQGPMGQGPMRQGPMAPMGQAPMMGHMAPPQPHPGQPYAQAPMGQPYPPQAPPMGYAAMAPPHHQAPPPMAPAWGPPGTPPRWAATPHPGGVPPRWPAAPVAARRDEGWKGWLLILGSIPLAGFGGLMTLGSIGLLASGDSEFSPGSVVMLLVALGLVPLGLGLVMFVKAVKIFNRP